MISSQSESRKWLGTPIRVDARPGHLWFPTLHSLGGEEVLCIAAVSADKPQGIWPASAYLSRDGGRTWQGVPEISRYALTSVFIGPRDILLLPYELAPASPGDSRTATALGTRITLDNSGTVTAIPQPVQFAGLPRAVTNYPHGGLCMVTGSNVIGLAGGTLFTTLYGRFIGEKRYSLLGMVSYDHGCHWSYRAQVANAEDFPDTQEGPSESSIVIFSDETLACIYRIGSGVGQNYHCSESTDSGHHWSRPRPLLGMGSVKPQWIRLNSGLQFLTGGRPGLSLWVSRDRQTWQAFDLADHHNTTINNPEQCFNRSWGKLSITTSYTALCPLDFKTALVCYDRLGNGWQGAPGPNGTKDAIYCLRIEV